MKKLQSLCLIVILWNCFCYAEQFGVIALDRLSSSGITEAEAFSLTNALRTELGKTGRFDVMERSQMKAILEEQGFQASGACDEASCALEIGHLLAVKYVVVGSIGQVGKTYTINIRLVNIGTGQITRDITENYKGAPDGLLTEVVPVAAQRLAGTYTKKNRRPIWIAASSAAVAAIAIPAAILATRDSDSGNPETLSRLRVQW